MTRLFRLRDAKKFRADGIDANWSHSARASVNDCRRPIGETTIGLQRRLNAQVETRQIAPTILQAFGIDADELKGVRAKHTQPLTRPGLPHRGLRLFQGVRR